MFGIHFGTPEVGTDWFSYRSQTTANVQEDDGLEFFEGDFAALQGVSLDIDKGEIVSLVGTSGCGKSTLLRIAAGLDFPTAGQVWVGDEAVRTPRPEICIVFQEPRLMP